MNEVLTRRFEHYESEQGTDSTFAIKPDLILLDGGQPQVNAVLPVIKSMNLDIPVFGMVKDSKHRTRAIATSGGEIEINYKRNAFTLISSIQEEVHRFAITYHRKKHKKSSFSSSLLEIDGIGEKKAKALLKHFKTISAVKSASVEKLSEVSSISKKNAEDIFKHFH